MNTDVKSGMQRGRKIWWQEDFEDREGSGTRPYHYVLGFVIWGVAPGWYGGAPLALKIILC